MNIAIYWEMIQTKYM